MIKKLLIVLGIILAFVIMGLIGLRTYTKSFSPQEKVELEDGELKIEIEYSRPFKKGRPIFGKLVPYNEVWRTGANEATVFKTNKDLKIKDNILPAGKYTLWTIPNEEVWELVWNNESGQWGVEPMDGKANRDPGKDQLSIETAVINSTKLFEQFTIDLDKVGNEIHFVLMWENTMIVVPMEQAKQTN